MKLFGLQNYGFTMAEILLSLTIIGVVAAITLPSLTGNINERTWNTQRKALYSRISQAVMLMPSLNGYGTLDETIDTAAETFLSAGLSKVLKINNICDNEHLEDCGLPKKIIPFFNRTNNSHAGGIVELSSITTMAGLNPLFNGSWVDYNNGNVYSYAQLDTKAAAFETANGESILAHYNPHCTGNMNETDSYYVQPKLCLNLIYDLNGSKGPNTMGKDMGFMSVIYPTDSIVVAPIFLNTGAGIGTREQMNAACRAKNEQSTIPNFGELMSLFYNTKLYGYNDFILLSNTALVKNNRTYYWTMPSSGKAYLTGKGSTSTGSMCVLHY